jgi:hypothetical protein
MRKRSCWLLAGSLLLVGLAPLALYLGRDRVTSEVFLGIKPGMTESEVVSLFGRPADEQFPALEAGVSFPPDLDPFPKWTKCWSGSEGESFFVLFDENQRVRWKSYLPADSRRPTLLESVRRMLGLQ